MSVCNHVRSHIGDNMRRVQLDTGTLIVPGLTRPSDIQHYTVYNVPDDQHWRFEMLESLREIRDDNWSVTFNEEEDDEAVLEENDIEDLIYEVCTS